jgi:hypothetical protein
MARAAIGPGSLFGFVTFSHKIGLYDVQGPIPVVKHIMILADMDAHIPVDLEMAMPLCAFLAPVCCTSSLYSNSVWSLAFDGYILCSMQLKSVVCVIFVFNFWN